MERDPDFWAVLGPNDEIDPAPEASPLSLAKMRTSGAIVKNSKAKKTPGPPPLVVGPLEDDTEDEDA